MQQEIKYGTFSAAPDDYLVPDGNLAAMAGLERKEGALWGELPSREKFILQNGYTIMCIHKVSDGTVNYICWCETHTLYKMSESGTFDYSGGAIYYFGTDVEVYKVEPVGNTLVVLTNNGVHYILWKNGYYRYLGTHLPELDLQFSMDHHHATLYSDEFKTGQITYSGDFFDWINDDGHKETLDKLRQAIMAASNQVVGTLTRQRLFVFPFFVRYAFRLYDGSLTMHSAPCLMIPTMDVPEVDMGTPIFITQGAPVGIIPKIKATFTGYGLWCKGTDAQAGELAQWSDIISSIDIFVSPQFYTYTQNPNDDEFAIDRGSGFNPPVNTQINRQIIENGNFYLIRQVPVRNGNNNQDPRLRNNGGEVEPGYEPTNENIVVRERMGDDYGTHDELFAEKSFAFNGRINLAGVSKRIFSGFNPACMWNRIGDTAHNTTTAAVVIETDGREITVESAEGDVYFTNSTNKVLWFYYPNTGAKRAYLTLGGQNIELELMPHATLNGAYYCSLDEDAVQQAVQYIPTPSSDEQRLVEQPNKVYTSEVNNPFYFPASGINTVGAGEILGICSAVRALSQGQFGQFPLYAFTTEGVWALQTNSEGGYSAVQPVTRDVCIDTDSITQMDDAVLFVTARGIMVISGSTSQCISEVIDGRVGFSLGMMTEKANALKLLAGGPAVALEMATFERFREGMRMLYDYRHQRIVVYNDTMEGGKKKYPYAYVYSLSEQQWSVAVNNLVDHINSYPDAIAVTADNMVVNLSEDGEPQGGIPFVMVTRPMDLGAADIHKTVTAVIQRGVFDKNHIQQVLFGSRDLLHWHLVSSSQDALLRGCRGTPYKWFRLMVLGTLDKGESIAGMTVQYDTRLTNKPR